MSGLRKRLVKQQRMTIELEHVAPELIKQLSDQAYIVQVQQTGRQLNLLLRTQADVRAQLSRLITEAGGVILKMQGDEMSLEEAFVTITSQDVMALADQPRKN